MSREEIERRYGLVRAAMDEHHLDAVLVCGSEYTGFEGAVTYMSGFTIVHRYAYVLLPREGEPTIVFPAEARYVGEHGDSWIEEQVFADRPACGLLRDRTRAPRHARCGRGGRRPVHVRGDDSRARQDRKSVV